MACVLLDFKAPPLTLRPAPKLGDFLTMLQVAEVITSCLVNSTVSIENINNLTTHQVPFLSYPGGRQAKCYQF